MVYLQAMRLIIHIPTTQPGGTENYVLRWLQYLCEHRPDIAVQLWVSAVHRGSLLPSFEEAAASVVEWDDSAVPLGKWLKMLRLMRKWKPDGYCNFNGGFALPGLILARLAGVPKRVVWHRRADYPVEVRWKIGVMKILHRGIERRATSLLSNSVAALDRFHPHRDRQDPKFRIIPNGIPVDGRDPSSLRLSMRTSMGWSDEDWVVGHVGRYTPVKNHDFLFRVVRLLLDHRPQLKLVLCGMGTDSAACLEAANRAGVASLTTFLGEVSDVRALYPALDAFVFPSKSESFPNALLEAALAGVRVFPSDISAHRAIFEGFEGGLIPLDDAGRAAQIIAAADEQPNEHQRAADLLKLRELTDVSKNFADFLTSFEG